MHFDCTGLRPHNQFNKGLLDQNERGYFIVDHFFRTSSNSVWNNNIFSIGDCCQTPNNMVKFASVTMDQADYLCDKV